MQEEKKPWARKSQQSSTRHSGEGETPRLQILELSELEYKKLHLKHIQEQKARLKNFQ